MSNTSPGTNTQATYFDELVAAATKLQGDEVLLANLAGKRTASARLPGHSFPVCASCSNRQALQSRDETGRNPLFFVPSFPPAPALVLHASDNPVQLTPVSCCDDAERSADARRLRREAVSVSAVSRE
jgi:hypothetical protein